MNRAGFTLVEAVLASSLAAAALVALLLVRQNCLRQITRAEELNCAARTAGRIINEWRILDSSETETVPLNGSIEESGLQWSGDVEDVEILPQQWLPGLTIRFFARTHSDKEPLIPFSGLKYPQQAGEELSYE